MTPALLDVSLAQEIDDELQRGWRCTMESYGSPRQESAPELVQQHSCGCCEAANEASHVRRGLSLMARASADFGSPGKRLPSSKASTANFVRTVGFAKLHGLPKRSGLRTCARRRNNLLPNRAGNDYSSAPNLGTCYRTRPSWDRSRSTSTSSTRARVRLLPGFLRMSLSPWLKFKRPCQDSKPARRCPHRQCSHGALDADQ